MKKVSVYLDEKTWDKFKASVFAKRGSLRYLSQEVETVLRSADAENALTSLSNRMGLNATGLISSSDIKKYRPKSGGPPSQEIIREMRQNRHSKTVCG